MNGLRCLIAAAALSVLQAHIHENYVQATDHGFYGEPHGTTFHVAGDMPHFGDGFGNLAQQHIHVAPKEGTKARECEDRMWVFSESDNLSYQKVEELRKITPEMSVVPHMWMSPFEMIGRYPFEDSLWQYRAPMFPKFCTDKCPDQEEIRCLADECFIRTNFCCATQCVPKDVNKRLAYMFTNNIPTMSDGKVTRDEVNSVIDQLESNLAQYPADVVGGASLSYRGWGNTEYRTGNARNSDQDSDEDDNGEEGATVKLLRETRELGIHCLTDFSKTPDEAGAYPPFYWDDKQEKEGRTPRDFAKCVHDWFKEKKEWRMHHCKWDTPVIKRKQPYGTKYTFRRRQEETWTEIRRLLDIRDGLVADLEMAQRAFLNCEAGAKVNAIHATLPDWQEFDTTESSDSPDNDDVDALGREIDSSADDAPTAPMSIFPTSFNRRSLAATLRRRLKSEACGGTGGVNAPELVMDSDGNFRSTGRLSQYCCTDEQAVIDALNDAIAQLDAQIKAVEIADPDITMVRVDCPICMYATGCPSTPPGFLELDNPGKRQWCSAFTQYSPCLFYPDPLPPADDEKSEDDLERRKELQTGMWLWERDANMYDNLDKCEIMPRTDDALHTCRCAFGYASKFGGNPGIDNPCVAVPHDHHHHGHHGEHGNEPTPEVETPAFDRPGYTLDREYDIVTYQSEHAVPLDDRPHNQEYWGYEEGHGMVNYGHLRPARGYVDDNEVHVADDNPDYKDQDDRDYDNTGYRYNDEGDFFHEPFGHDNDGRDDDYGVGYGLGGHYGGMGDDNNNDNDGGFGSIFDGFPMFRGARGHGFGSSCCTIIGMAFMAMGVFLLSFYA